jgi:hypothetical protein
LKTDAGRRAIHAIFSGAARGDGFDTGFDRSSLKMAGVALAERQTGADLATAAPPAPMARPEDFYVVKETFQSQCRLCDRFRRLYS